MVEAERPVSVYEVEDVLVICEYVPLKEDDLYTEYDVAPLTELQTRVKELDVALPTVGEGGVDGAILVTRL